MNLIFALSGWALDCTATAPVETPRDILLRALRAHSDHYYLGFYNPQPGELVDKITQYFDLPERDESLVLDQSPDWAAPLASFTLNRDKYYALFDSCVSAYRVLEPIPAIDSILSKIYHDRLHSITPHYHSLVSTPLTLRSHHQLYQLIIGHGNTEGVMRTELAALVLLKELFE
jgi:hypothetical protein